ncbi:restriction endonuclease [Alkalihalobacterium bogoriense]|uniref:restriction endonuclease n=1 Tax=Alkalihalobacterium bogoriense TaxID=246272 RepID=UPI0006888E6A|nr:restriction endonuclease [Alkalihalobacterium bogoriense]
MFNFVKEAINAVIKKDENLKMIEETNYNLKLINIELQNAKQTLSNTEKKYSLLELEITKKNELLINLKKEENVKQIEKYNLDLELGTLKEKYKRFSKNNKEIVEDIATKGKKLRELEDKLKFVEIELIENSNYNKIQSLTRLCGALKRTLEKKQNKYPRVTILSSKSDIIPKPFPKPKRDSLLDDLSKKFNDTHDCFCLAVPGVIEHILKQIEEINSQGDWRGTISLYNSSYKYIKTKEMAWDLYINHISVFFTLLMRKGYLLVMNESFYLNILKEKALEKNYNELEDELYQLLQINENNVTLQEVIGLYISIVEEQMSQFNYLGFLNLLLVKKGFIESYLDFDDLYALVEIEYKNYEITKLENELFKPQAFILDKKVSIDDIELMTGEEFEKFLVEILGNLGFRANVTKKSGDQGVDIVAKRNSKIYAIQAKRYSGKVGNKAVQEVVSGKEYYGADVSWVITNSSFTQSAVNLAAKTNTLLWDGYRLKSILELNNL